MITGKRAHASKGGKHNHTVLRVGKGYDSMVTIGFDEGRLEGSACVVEPVVVGR